MGKKYKSPATNYQLLIANDGFSLMELVVTLAIMTIMIALFLTNYRSGSRNTDLTFAAQKLVSDVRSAQNNSIGSVFYAGNPPSGGWGIHFNMTSGVNTSYILFADINNNKIYDVGEDTPASGGQTIVLPSNIIVSSIDAGGSSRAQLDITFLPPDPITRIYWNGASSSTSATISLKETTEGKEKNLNVNILGLIETP